MTKILSSLIVGISLMACTSLANPTVTEPDASRQDAIATPMPDLAFLAEESGLSDTAHQGGSTASTPNGEILEDETEPSDVGRQNPSTDPMPDAAIMAEEMGLPEEIIRSAMAFQEAFGKYVGELIDRFPNQISSIYSDSPPGEVGLSTRRNIQFIGEVPPGIAPMENVFLTGGGMISMADHAIRAQVAARALADMGYHNHVTHSDAIGNVIRIELLLPEGELEPDRLEAAAVIHDRLQADPRLGGVAATLDPFNLDLIVSRGSGPIITFQ